MEEIYKKVLNKEKLTERELREFIFEGFHECWKTGENSRCRRVFVVNKIDDRYFAISFEEGLTENQDDIFNQQPYEVIKEEKVVTKTEINWIEIK